MTPAEYARNHAISLEAKKDALAQRQNGDWKVSFTVQGIDMDPRLTQAAMGTRYAVVLVEIGDDELPVPAKEKPAKAPASPKPAGAKRDWRELPPSQQAGIRCEEPAFEQFLKEERQDDWAEAQSSRDSVCLICGVESRADLSINQKARVIWHQLDTQYQAWKALEHA